LHLRDHSESLFSYAVWLCLFEDTINVEFNFSTRWQHISKNKTYEIIIWSYVICLHFLKSLIHF